MNVSHITLFISDPKELNLPLLTKALHFYPDPSEAPEVVRDLNQKVLEADALIVISAEYNYTIPPALTNTLDYIPPSSFGYKPCGIVTYGIGKYNVDHFRSKSDSRHIFDS